MYSASRLALVLLCAIGVLALAACSSGPRTFRSSRSLDGSADGSGSGSGSGGGSVVSGGQGDGGSVAGDDGSDGSADEHPDTPEPLFSELTVEVVNQVNAYVLDLGSEDQLAVHFAQDQLVKMGPVVIPVLEKQFTESNALAIVETINLIRDTYNLTDDDTVDSGDGESGTGNDSGGNENNSGDGADGDSGHGDGAPDNGGTPNGSGNGDFGGAAPAGPIRAESLFRAPLANPAYDPQVIGTYLWEKLAEMERAAERGQYEHARALGAAVLTLEPNFAYRRELVARLRQIDDELLRRSLLRARVTPVTPEAAYGEPITFKIAIKNVSDVPIRIVLSRAEPRARLQEELFPSPCVVTVRFTRWSDPRSPLTEQSQELLELDGDITLDPGDVWSTDWVIYTQARGDELAALGTYEVSATIRPLQVLKREEEIAMPMIHCEPGSVRVYPAYYRTVQNEPLRHLQTALVQQPMRPVYLLCAASAIEAITDRAAAVPLLLEALGASTPEVRQAVFTSLRTITGYAFGYDERGWRHWYNAHKRSPTLDLEPFASEDDDEDAPDPNAREFPDLDLSDFGDDFDPTPEDPTEDSADGDSDPNTD